jgi:alkylhydroperoxidase family enzyme
LAALRWAERMTLEPHLCDDAGAEALREAGLDDKQILQVTLVASYFNFVNRNVLALGVQLEEGFEKTCD